MTTAEKHTLDTSKWVDLYADYLFNYTIARVDDQEVAKDLVQETFLAGLKGSEGFQGKASEKTWLVSILKRKIIDYYRKINSAKGQAEVRVAFHENEEREGHWLDEAVPQSWENATEKSISSKELSKVLNFCISKLPEKYAMVFKMKTIQEFDTEEICKELDISTTNFWVLIHRARVQLRKCMEVNWFGNDDIKQ